MSAKDVNPSTPNFEALKSCDDLNNTPRQINGFRDNPAVKRKVSVWPYWPPGQNNITYNPPYYPKVVIPKFWNLAHGKRISIDTSAYGRKKSLETDSVCQCSKEYERFPLRYPIAPNPLGASANEYRSTFDINMNCLMNNKKVVKEATPILKRPHNVLFSRPLNAKSDACKEFHRKYPDPVPDLRDARRSIRKVTFYGYNGNCFR